MNYLSICSFNDGIDQTRQKTKRQDNASEDCHSFAVIKPRSVTEKHFDDFLVVFRMEFGRWGRIVTPIGVHVPSQTAVPSGMVDTLISSKSVEWLDFGKPTDFLVTCQG